MPLTVRTEESTPVADMESLQQPCKPGQLMLSQHQYVQQEHISNTGNKSRQSHQYQPTQYSLGMQRFGCLKVHLVLLYFMERFSS